MPEHLGDRSRKRVSIIIEKDEEIGGIVVDYQILGNGAGIFFQTDQTEVGVLLGQCRDQLWCLVGGSVVDDGDRELGSGQAIRSTGDGAAKAIDNHRTPVAGSQNKRDAGTAHRGIIGCGQSSA